MDAEREKAQKEIEQLKTNHEMSLGKKEREVSQPRNEATSSSVSY